MKSVKTVTVAFDTGEALEVDMDMGAFRATHSQELNNIGKMMILVKCADAEALQKFLDKCRPFSNDGSPLID